MVTHLTLSEMATIKQELSKQTSLYAIAKIIGKPLFTVTREVAKHRVKIKKASTEDATMTVFIEEIATFI